MVETRVRTEVNAILTTNEANEASNNLFFGIMRCCGLQQKSRTGEGSWDMVK